MRNIFFYLSLLAMLWLNNSSAQQNLPCATDELLQNFPLTNPIHQQNLQSFLKDLECYKNNPPVPLPQADIKRVRVVVHVLHLAGTPIGTSENIAGEQIRSMIEVLNASYRKVGIYAGNGVDTKIEFCLATTDPNGNSTNGITRTASSIVDFDNTAGEDPAMISLKQSTSKTLLMNKFSK